MLKAKIDGFEIEGPSEEISQFMRDYMHRRQTPALPLPVVKNARGGGTPKTGRTAAVPTQCPMCLEPFPSKSKMHKHKVEAHGRYTRPKAVDPAQETPPEQGEEDPPWAKNPGMKFGL